MSTHAVTLVLIKLALITLSSNLEWIDMFYKCFTKTSSWNANTCLMQPNRGVWDKLQGFYYFLLPDLRAGLS